MERIAIQFREAMNRKLSGIGVVEVILILLVLVGLVIIFKDQITNLAKTIFSSIGSQVNQL